jgi:hypothetical protein
MLSVHQSLESIHDMGFTHQALCSDSFFFFRDQVNKDANLLDPYISGFGSSLIVDHDETFHPPPDDLRLVFYRHPTLTLRGDRHDGGYDKSEASGFPKSNDLFALGIVLLELALWEPIEAIMDVDLRHARSLENVVVARQKMSSNTDAEVWARVSTELGDAAVDAIRKCLKGGKNMWSGADEQEDLSARSAKDLERTQPTHLVPFPSLILSNVVDISAKRSDLSSLDKRTPPVLDQVHASDSVSALEPDVTDPSETQRTGSRLRNWLKSQWPKKKTVDSPSVPHSGGDNLPSQSGLGLYVLHQPETASVDIIFVHSFGGHSQRTWSQNQDPSLFWPKLWLPFEPDIGVARFMFFGYSPNNYGNANDHLFRSISDIAKDLLNFMRRARDAAGEHPGVNQNPVIFVAHNTGGLIIKQTAFMYRQSSPRTHLRGVHIRL